MDFYADYKAKYAALCKKRDAVNAKVAPLQEQLDAANAKQQAGFREAEELSASIQKVRGGQAWLDLKKEIGLLAKLLSGVKS